MTSPHDRSPHPSLPADVKTDERLHENVLIYNPALTEIHGTAVIGEHSRVGSFTIIHDDVVIGERCTIGSHCNICPGVRIGSHVSIQTGCHVTRSVVIGDESFLGPGVITMNDRYMSNDPRRDDMLEPPVIGRNVRIGGGSCLLPGIVIGDNATVGAGSVVTMDVPAGVTVYGNPARRVADTAGGDSDSSQGSAGAI